MQKNTSDNQNLATLKKTATTTISRTEISKHLDLIFRWVASKSPSLWTRAASSSKLLSFQRHASRNGFPPENRLIHPAVNVWRAILFRFRSIKKQNKIKHTALQKQPPKIIPPVSPSLVLWKLNGCCFDHLDLEKDTVAVSSIGCLLRLEIRCHGRQIHSWHRQPQSTVIDVHCNPKILLPNSNF